MSRRLTAADIEANFYFSIRGIINGCRLAYPVALEVEELWAVGKTDGVIKVRVVADHADAIHGLDTVGGALFQTLPHSECRCLI